MRPWRCPAGEFAVYLVRMGTRGQITLSVEVRRLLGVGPREIVGFTDDATTFWLTKRRS